MNTLAPELELLRAELHRAYRRDLARRVTSRRRRMFVAVAAATLVSLFAGVASAGNPVTDAFDDAVRWVMSAFTADRDEQAASDARDDLQQMEDLARRNPDASAPGAIADAQTQRLLRWSGRGITATILAAPTTRDEVCYLVRIDRSGNGDRGGRFCVDALTAERPVHVTSPTVPGASRTVYGIASDDVRAVSVRTDAGTELAEFGRNAFFWTAATPQVRATALELQLRDGQEMTVPIRSPEDS